LISQSTGAGKGTYEKRVGKRDAWVAQLVELLGLLAQRGARFSLALCLLLCLLVLSLSDKQRKSQKKNKTENREEKGRKSTLVVPLGVMYYIF